MAVFRSFVLKQKNQKFKPVLRRMLRTSIRCIAGMFRAAFVNNIFSFCYKVFAQNAVPFAATFRCKTGGRQSLTVLLFVHQSFIFIFFECFTSLPNPIPQLV
jgi:hypothetical protein